MKAYEKAEKEHQKNWPGGAGPVGWFSDRKDDAGKLCME
jgi:hypothetical protein